MKAKRARKSSHPTQEEQGTSKTNDHLENKNREFHYLVDKVEFGEVVDQPPKLVQLKKAKGKVVR